MIRGFDCATKLNAKTAAGLKNTGFEYAIRYLPTTTWKGLTKAEVKAIQNAGLKLVSIFQRSANFAGYFTIAQGRADGVQAKKLAESLGQTKDTAIYFAVDYDAQPKNIGGVLAYVKGVKETLKDYRIGIYGSYRIMNEVKQKEPVDYYWQTYAWSYGKVASHIHMYQYQNGVKVAGVQLDRNNIYQVPGAWTEVMKKHPTQPQPKQPKEEKYTLVTSVKGYYRADDAKNQKDDRTLVAKGTYYVFNRAKIDGKEMINVTTKPGTPGSWINPVSNVSKQEPKPEKKEEFFTHKVVRGDTLSGLAQFYGTSVNELVKLNGIKNPNLIVVGQKIRIPTKKKVVYHTVVSGDTVSKLARKYGSSVKEITTWNKLKDPNLIIVGQKLQVK